MASFLENLLDEGDLESLEPTLVKSAKGARGKSNKTDEEMTIEKLLESLGKSADVVKVAKEGLALHKEIFSKLATRKGLDEVRTNLPGNHNVLTVASALAADITLMLKLDPAATATHAVDIAIAAYMFKLKELLENEHND